MIATDIDVVRAVFEAFAERDVEGVLAHSATDIEFTAVTGDHAGRTEPYRGHDGMRQYFRDVASRLGRAANHPGRIPHGRRHDPRDRPRERPLARPDRGRLDRLDLASPRDGKVTYVRVYASAADAMAAFDAGSSCARPDQQALDLLRLGDAQRPDRRRVDADAGGDRASGPTRSGASERPSASSSPYQTP